MRIGLLGLGNMGSAMGLRLIEGGHSLTVYNRTSQKAEPLRAQGAVVANSAREASQEVEIVITILSDDRALIETLEGEDGLLSGMRPGAIHLSMSTISVAQAESLQLLHEKHGSVAVGAPVFGRPDAARAGKLYIAVGGDAEAIGRCEPVFASLAQNVFQMGSRPRDAHLTKLLGNFMLISTIEMLGEAIAVARKSELNARRFLDAMTGSLFQAPLYKNYGGMMVDENYRQASGFKLPLALKDVRLALLAAEKVGVSLPFGSLVRDHLMAAINRGDGELDLSALAKFAAENAGLK